MRHFGFDKFREAIGRQLSTEAGPDRLPEGVLFGVLTIFLFCGRVIALAVLPRYFTLIFGLIWWLPTAQHDVYFEPPDYLCCLMNCFSVRSFLKEVLAYLTGLKKLSHAWL